MSHHCVQPSLFERPPAVGRQPMRARADDPESSHAAADKLESSGAAARQAQIAYDAVLQWPGRTSAELAHHCELDRYQLARRLPELEDRGLIHRGDVRACTAHASRGLTWWPGAEQRPFGQQDTAESEGVTREETGRRPVPHEQAEQHWRRDRPEAGPTR